MNRIIMMYARIPLGACTLAMARCENVVGVGFRPEVSDRTKLSRLSGLDTLQLDRQIYGKVDR